MPIHPISRRQVLQFAAAGVAGAAIGSRVQAEPVAANPSGLLHRYPDYAWLRGFSVVPSWGATIEEAWAAYHPDRFREEIALAKTVHANCIRLWIEFTAWFGNPDKVTGHFLDAVKAIGELGMTAMPCIFNRWHDSQYDYGGTYIENLSGNLSHKIEYVKWLVVPLVNDPRVLIWDLCNEPQAFNLDNDINKKEYAWLELVAKTIRELGAKQPITIGTMSGGNVTTFAPICDVLCAHPYAQKETDLANLIKTFIVMRDQAKKPMLVNECIPGAMDDQVRAGVARYYTEQLSAAGLGWMGWALREGKAISTQRERVDGNGINGQGFHPFFTKAGKLRGGLEFMLEKPALLPPWQK